MIVIFGWEKHAERLGEVCQAYCYDCQKKVPWEVGQMTGWVSFFDVPILPFKREYFMFCGVCGDDFALTRSDYKQVDTIMQSTGALDNSELKQQLFHTIEQKQLDDKNEIQLRWIKANRASQEHLKELERE